MKVLFRDHAKIPPDVPHHPPIQRSKIISLNDFFTWKPPGSHPLREFQAIDMPVFKAEMTVFLSSRTLHALLKSSSGSVSPDAHRGGNINTRISIRNRRDMLDDGQPHHISDFPVIASNIRMGTSLKMTVEGSNQRWILS